MLENPIKIAIAEDDSYLTAVGVGNIEVISNVRGEKIKCTIKNVFYVPKLCKNLLSVKKLETSKINIIQFQNGEVKLKDKNNRLLGVGYRKNIV